MNLDTKKYACIFGGGAVRGFSYIGAIKALEELEIKIDTFAGSSVGSIFASLLAVGYNEKELEDVLFGVNFKVFRDIRFSFDNIIALSKGEVYLDWIRKLIEQKFYGEDYKKGENPPVRFKDLKNNLVIFSTDFVHFKNKEFSKELTPDFEIATAVKISSSMPGLMPPFEYEGTELVDGDLQKSWSLWELSDTLKNSNDRILEFRLEGSYEKDCKTALNYINNVYSALTSIATNAVEERYKGLDKVDYITINTGSVLIADFNIPDKKRKELIKLGYNKTINYFKKDIIKKRKFLLTHYQTMYDLIDKVVLELDKNNVLEAKANICEAFVYLCEHKNKLNNSLYEDLKKAKTRLYKELKPKFFNYSAKKVESVNEDFKQIQNNLQNILTEFKNQIKSVKKQ